MSTCFAKRQKDIVFSPTDFWYVFENTFYFLTEPIMNKRK